MSRQTRTRARLSRRSIWLCLIILVATIASILFYPSYLLHKAEINLKRRSADGAIRILTRFEALYGPSGDSSLLLARAYRRLGQMSEAKSRLLQAERLGIPAERAQRELWLCFAQGGQMAEAGRHLGTLLLSPEEDGAEICEAYVAGYVALHRFAEASSLLDGWLEDYPEDDQAWFFRGRIDAAAERPADALKSYEKALSINPARTDIRAIYAQTLMDLRSFEAAEQQYAELLKTSADSVDVLRGWGQWLEQSGRTKEAIEVARKVVALSERSFDAELQLAELLYQQGEYSEAQLILEKLRTAAPRNKDVCFALGSVLRLTGNADAAQKFLEYAQEAEAELASVSALVSDLQKRPDNLDLRLEIAHTLMSYGREEEGIEWLQSVFAYDPEHVPTLERLAAHFETAGQTEKAQAYRQRLRAVQSREPTPPTGK